MKRFAYLATAAKGTESLLAEELEELGASGVRAERGIVHFHGDSEMGWRANLWLRTAMRVLRPLKDFGAEDADALYQGVQTIRWEEHLSTSHTFSVEAQTKDNQNLNHSHFVALKVKDAIVDQMRDQLGARPSVNPKDPDVTVIVHIAGNRCSLSLDMSGDPLFKRGYRVRAVTAPLKETLAAALVLSTTWGGRRTFSDPMCGSGTIVIEAAMIAMNRAPGRLRQFAFQRWPSWGATQVKRWKEIQSEADEQAIARAPGRIIASDASEEALMAAQANSQAAKVFSSLEFARRDVRSFPPSSPPPVLLMNPPYGERIGGRGEELSSLYKGIGARLSQLQGVDAYLFTAKESKLAEQVGLPIAEVQTFWNGPLEAGLYKFEVR